MKRINCIYWEPQEPVNDALSQLKPSNDICESILGLNDDCFIKCRPSFSVNFVSSEEEQDWLDTLPQQKQESIVNLAVKEISDACKQEAKERASRRKQILVQSHTHREALKQKQLAEREELYHLITNLRRAPFNYQSQKSPIEQLLKLKLQTKL